MRWDFFVRHYADDARQRLDEKYRVECDGRRVDGVSTRARGRSAAARPTTP